MDSQYLYTDNAMLTRRPVRSSTELVNTIRAAFAPTPYKMGNGRFAPSIGYLSQWYDYGLGGDDLSVMDFNVQTAFRERFRELSARQRLERDEFFKSIGMDSIVIETGQAYIDRLIRFFKERSRRFRR